MSTKLIRLNNEKLSQSSYDQLNSWTHEKINRPDWYEHFLLMAYLVSIRSLDSQTQCGCVITKNKTIIGTGYNSFVRNIDDYAIPNTRPDKYPFMIHSEHNAVLNCAKNGISCNGAQAFVTTRPCCNCLQFMYQAGISDIFYPNVALTNMSDNEESKIRFEILSHLIPIDIYVMELEPEILEKIEKIKSLRG